MQKGQIKSITIILILLLSLVSCDKQESDSKPDKVTNVENSTTDRLVVEVLDEGSGPETQSGDNIQVHYTGYLEDGRKFDSSLDRGRPFTFTLGAGQVIKGWDQGLLGKKEGSKIVLKIPPHLAYGSRGAGGVIPPDATLRFEVQIVDNLSR
jgi:FKBP-type peptidyl-prolyl cis-trans isomerase